MIKNKIEKKIYDIILNDISTRDNNYSTLTNSEIAMELKISAFTVRDKVISLYKKDFLKCYVNYWDENNKFFHRQLLLGDKTITE